MMIERLKKIKLWQLLTCAPLLIGVARAIHFSYTGYMVPDEAYYYSSIFIWFKSGKLLFPFGRFFFQFMLFVVARLLNLNTVEKFYTIVPIFLSGISCLTILLGVKIVEKKDPEFKEKWIVPLLFLLSPTYLILTSLVLTEITTVFIMMIILYLFVSTEEKGKMRHTALIGLLIGLVCDWREFLLVIPVGISLRYLHKKKYWYLLVFIIFTLVLGSQTYGRGMIVSSNKLSSFSSTLIDMDINISTNENVNIAISESIGIIGKVIGNIAKYIKNTGKIVREIDIVERVIDPLRKTNVNYTILEWNFGVLPSNTFGGSSPAQFIFSVVINFFFVLAFSLGVFVSIPLGYMLIKKRKYEFWVIMGLSVILISIIYISSYGTYSHFIFGKISTVVRYGLMGIFVIPFVALYTKGWPKKQLKIFFIIAVVSTSLMIVPFTKLSQSNLGSDINRVFQPGYKAPWLILHDYLEKQNDSKIIVICDPIIVVKLYPLENVEYTHIPSEKRYMSELFLCSDVIYVYGEKYIFYETMHETQVEWYYLFLRDTINYKVIFEDSQMYLYKVIK